MSRLQATKGLTLTLSPSDGAREKTILVAGMGNLLLTDDGIGVHAVRELQKETMPGVTVVEIGTAILHGLHFLESATRVLVIDAAKGGQPPGTIYLFEAGDSKEPVTSIHAMGLREATRLLPPGVSAPRLTVLGVEPASLDYGMELSSTVQKVLPKVVALARETIEGWQRLPEVCEDSIFSGSRSGLKNADAGVRAAKYEVL